MPYFPNTNYILPITTVRRDRRLPPDVAAREVLVEEGQRVDPSTPVLRGARAGNYRIVSLTAPLGVRKAEDIDTDWILVAENDIVKAGQPLAQRGSGRRAKKLDAPVDCIISRVEPDRLILQSNPEEVEIRAIYNGMVTAVRSKREIQIEAVGAVIQCAWGNGRSAFGVYKEEPPEGLQSLANEEGLLTTFRGQVLLTRKSLTAETFSIARKQDAAAVIGPGMGAELREAALKLSMPVILTEGFGSQKMSDIVYNLLRDNLGRQAAIVAVEPVRFSSDRPEIFIPLPSGGSLPPMPERDQPLYVGVIVQITREPYAGEVGIVRRVFTTPQVFDNGLRMAGAEVQLERGEPAIVPVANLKALGRLPDGRR